MVLRATCDVFMTSWYAFENRTIPAEEKQQNSHQTHWHLSWLLALAQSGPWTCQPSVQLFRVEWHYPSRFVYPMYVIDLFCCILLSCVLLSWKHLKTEVLVHLNHFDHWSNTIKHQHLNKDLMPSEISLPCYTLKLWAFEPPKINDRSWISVAPFAMRSPVPVALRRPFAARRRRSHPGKHLKVGTSLYCTT